MFGFVTGSQKRPRNRALPRLAPGEYLAQPLDSRLSDCAFHLSRLKLTFLEIVEPGVLPVQRVVW
jgi:hypothetical protein